VSRTFAPTFEQVVNIIRDLMDYLKSDILINRIQEDTVQLSSHPFLAILQPFVVRSIYIDTPNREITIATLSYPERYGADGDYYIVFVEDVVADDLNYVVAKCSRKQFEETNNILYEILKWYNDHRIDISLKKFSILGQIYALADETGKQQIEQILEELKKG